MSTIHDFSGGMFCHTQMNDFLSPLIFQKMEKIISVSSVNNNTRMGLVISLCLNSNYILEIYSVVAP